MPTTHSAPEQSAAMTFADWLAAQDLLAASLKAKHIKATHSGHHVYAYQPRLVVDVTRDTVDAVRRKQRSTPR
jgi:hypothetical protein